MSGVSAGAICWFEAGLTNSLGPGAPGRGARRVSAGGVIAPREALPAYSA